jgi:hypothetical protein
MKPPHILCACIVDEAQSLLARYPHATSTIKK